MEEIDHQNLSFSEEEEETESEEEIAVDDSEEDPDFDVLEETRSSLSRLSLKKTKSRISKVIESDKDEEPDDVEIKVPELNAKDAKSFENVEKIIAAGQLEKLKVEQCKIYLRKNGLRLTGKKDVLMERIKEHLGIINGGGELKYPVSSFVYNCKGDACTGDVVMFEQNVYEMYNVASRSATGPPCGTRTVAGRIVKESYGSAKQQHTFTIEVLWSKGVKPLPPLHPLLIKGRNLYKLKTMRQLWTDEEMRRKVLLEKHSRGSLARSNRETRKKEMRKKSAGQRVLRNERNTVLENQLPAIHTKQPTQSGHNKPAIPPKKVLTEVCVNTTMASSITEQRHDGSIKIGNIQSNGYQVGNHKQNHTSDKVYANANANKLQNNGVREVDDKKSSRSQFPRNTQQHANNVSEKLHQHNGIRGVEDKQRSRSQFSSNTQQHANTVSEKLHQSQHSNVNQSSFNAPPRNSILGRAPSQRQVCKYYPQGRCYFGKNCKYLHEDRGKHVNGVRMTAKPSYPNENESSFNSSLPSPTHRSYNSSVQSPIRRSFNAPAQNSFNCPPRSPNHRSFNSPMRSPTHRSFDCAPWSPNRGGPPMREDRGKHVNGARRIAKPSYPSENESSFNAPPWSPTRRSYHSPVQSPTRRSFNAPAQNSFDCPPRSPIHSSFNSPMRSPTHNSPSRGSFNCPPWSPSRGGPPKQQQVCRYYAQGRCYHGKSCKYLHER